MFTKIGKTGKRNAFVEEVVTDQRKRLQENLEKLDVPAAEQEKIMKMRERLPDNYHEMPLEKPSRCLWFFENVSLPEKTRSNQHRIDAFEQCGCELLKAAGLNAESEVESSGTGMKHG